MTPSKTFGLFQTFLKVLCLISIWTAPVFAGPPFLTDDPEPVDYRHWEAYLFAMGDHTGSNFTIDAPAAEVNYGVFPDVQLHALASLTSIGGAVPHATGLGDAELGVKYRFIHETDALPQVAIFPAIELPTSDANRGLGNGHIGYRLPVWVQKSWGQWTSYGGGGAMLNSAAGQDNYPFGGWLLQRDFNEQLTLSGELFAQGRDKDDDNGFAALNFGGSWKVSEHFSGLFSAGHSIFGDEHTVWYGGLIWTL